MSAGADAQETLRAVPLLNAVFCADCETISNSPHDVCTICGSHSLVSLFRMLGGTLRSQNRQSTGDPAKPAKYSLELTAKLREIPATELNHVTELLTRLAEVAGDVESLHLDVDSTFSSKDVLRAA